MTDRHAGYLVILNDDERADYSAHIAAALRMVKGVARVEPIPSTPDIAARIVDERTREAWRALLVKMLRDLNEGQNPA